MNALNTQTYMSTGTFVELVENEVAEGGIPGNTLNVLAAGAQAGKSTTTMIPLAAMYMRLGYNVLYISNEMSEEEVSQLVQVQALKSRTQGRLKVKEYGPCPSIIINELENKQDFVPDVIMVDYMGITDGSDFKEMTKRLFAFAKMSNIAIWVATPLAREGGTNFGDRGVSVDRVWELSRGDGQFKNGILTVKKLKNRFS